MNRKAIQPTRIQPLTSLSDRKGDHVVYWMQQSQRAEYNHALEFAIQQANRLGQGLLVVFGLTDSYPEANLRHYRFMLEGLRETASTLAQRGIKMIVRKGHPAEIAVSATRRASLMVCDRGYLRHQKTWRDQVARQAPCPVIQVESDAIMPVGAVSQKAEYAARTIRPKILRQLADYLVELTPTPVDHPSLNLPNKGLDLQGIDGILSQLKLDSGVVPVSRFFKGGTSQAKTLFEDFMNNRLARYRLNHNQPQTDDTSRMSPYLHFGQISPLYLALQIKSLPASLELEIEAYLEELIVRRELAVNFTEYTPGYDCFDAIPRWARETLARHQKDRRPYVYTQKQLEDAQTHDPYWNAAMREMKQTGFMHTYMRMYWGKKIIEWSETPEQAFKTTLALNNKYLLDGRDPNSYAGVAWNYGVHDRAWVERPVFGKIRYMAASGLERKCDIAGYVKKVDALFNGT